MCRMTSPTGRNKALVVTPRWSYKREDADSPRLKPGVIDILLLSGQDAILDDYHK